jgi:8-oxo-dGTP pyrophosphatase MutT (NUDIX family)
MPTARRQVAGSPQRRRRADETSAGGLVVRTEDGTPSGALIGRLDRRGRLRWSLPKGHVELGETHEQAAIREVEEETGISGRITARLGSVEYTFIAQGRRIHKRVHHYLMVAVAGELSDADIEVTEVAWVPLTDLAGRLAYAGERRLARRAVELLAESA